MTQPGMRRIAADLRAAIGRGEYDASPKLPSAMMLSDQTGASYETCARALRLLVGEGTAVARRGLGTYAVPRADRQSAGNAP